MKVIIIKKLNQLKNYQINPKIKKKILNLIQKNILEIKIILKQKFVKSKIILLLKQLQIIKRNH